MNCVTLKRLLDVSCGGCRKITISSSLYYNLLYFSTGVYCQAVWVYASSDRL